MKIVKGQQGQSTAIYDNNGKLQGYTDEGLYIIFNNNIYEMYYTAWGWVIRVGRETERVGFRWAYMSKSYKGQYEFRLDHTWAKSIKNKKIAWNHVLSIARQDGAPV